jgi:hypothetical protein
MNVFITVDTEISPRSANWLETGLAADIRRDIYGRTPGGDFGVPYQIKVLNRHGIKATFFVEALFPCAVGPDPLREIVSLIKDGGHDVQLHLHTEWLGWMPRSILPGKTGQNIQDFSEDDQAFLLGKGIANLQACGADRLCAFRAGNYGANFATLRALQRNGILYDTSYNACYLDSDCGLATPTPLLQPTWFDGVCEFPIAFFRDRPGHYRHAQLCACSGAEMRHALVAAWERGWHSFVIVSHSFELLKHRKDPGRPALPDPIVVRRFEDLCRFLADHRDKFQTPFFSDLDPAAIPSPPPGQPLRSPLHRTIGRQIEQLARRVR